MNITLSVSGELEQLVKQHPEVKWTAIARSAMEEQAGKIMKLEILRKYLDKEQFTEIECQWMDKNDWHPMDEKQLKQNFITSIEKAKTEKGTKLKNVDESLQPMQRIIEQVKNNKKVLAVLVFGSMVDNKNHPFSDIDICLVMPKANEKTKRQMLLTASGSLPEEYDIKIFEEMPLMLKGEVIKNNKVVFSKSENELHEYLWKWKKIYDDYQHQYKLANIELKERLKKWKKSKE